MSGNQGIDRQPCDPWPWPVWVLGRSFCLRICTAPVLGVENNKSRLHRSYFLPSHLLPSLSVIHNNSAFSSFSSFRCLLTSPFPRVSCDAPRQSVSVAPHLLPHSSLRFTPCLTQTTRAKYTALRAFSNTFTLTFTFTLTLTLDHQQNDIRVLATDPHSSPHKMADGEGHHGFHAGNPGDGTHLRHRPSEINTVPLAQVESPMSPRTNTPNPFSRQHTSLDIDDYFVRLDPVLAPLPQLNMVSASSCDLELETRTLDSLGYEDGR